MAGITPVSGMGALTPSAAGALKPAVSGAGNIDFGQLLKTAIGGADKPQENVVAAIQDLLSGKSKDVLPAVQAMAKADMSFKLLMGVRNKVIDAYKQTLSMQL
ncbi:MAG: flagellar hook-basal body complex protein FliE [Planctomycetaceae bacterium]|nr:flagellar hook-basal body complex protein FliE [Planctomycetaceae bacterium]